jgi:sulfofructose kinase
MNARWDVMGFGVVAVDNVVMVDRYPLPDTKVQMRGQQRHGGGLTGTALVAAARLGAKAAYCGVLGDDELSRFTLQELEREGVDCAAILHRPGARPYNAIVIVDQATGQRTILYTRQGVVQRPPEEMTDELIGDCRVLFVDYMAGEGGLRAIELAHARSIPVVGDIERGTAPCIPDLVRRIDHLIVGAEFGEQFTGETQPERMVRALAGPDRTCCVVTVGDQGCWYVERGGDVRHFPAFRVQVVDTTGCGDVFHGAYAACIAWGESVDRAIQVATAAAGIKATKPGGRSGIPDLATVERFLRDHRSAFQS